MAERIDIISPQTIGEQKLDLTLDPNSKLVIDQPVSVDIDYSRADAEGGVVLPLIIEVLPVSDPSKVSYSRNDFKRTRPSSFTFNVEVAGEYTVLVRESGHNRWMGQLTMTIEGDRFSRIRLCEGF